MPTKIEIERKFLLKKVPLLKYDQTLFIFQYYLPDGSRLRETRNPLDAFDGTLWPYPFGKSKYELTIKKRIKAGMYKETEKEISKKSFDRLKCNATSIIQKIRSVYKVGKLKWEIDKYKNDLRLVTAEIEIPTENHKFKIPPVIQREILLDVTEYPQFTNKALSL